MGRLRTCATDRAKASRDMTGTRRRRRQVGSHRAIVTEADESPDDSRAAGPCTIPLPGHEAGHNELPMPPRPRGPRPAGLPWPRRRAAQRSPCPGGPPSAAAPATPPVAGRLQRALGVGQLVLALPVQRLCGGERGLGRGDPRHLGCGGYWAGGGRWRGRVPRVGPGGRLRGGPQVRHRAGRRGLRRLVLRRFVLWCGGLRGAQLNHRRRVDVRHRPEAAVRHWPESTVEEAARSTSAA